MPYQIPKYDAKVFLDRFSIDIGTMKQIKLMIAHKSMSHVRIMPDCHRGNGCCIGLTSELTTTIVPNFVGGDIGCGMTAYPINKSTVKYGCPAVEKIIRDKIKMGSGARSIWDHPIACEDDMIKIYDNANEYAQNFAHAYNKKFNDKKIFEYIPNYTKEWFEQLCKKVNTDSEYDMRSLGTLGSGNHYVEICKDKNDNEWLIIHSGSKNIGSKICKYHQDKITEGRRFNGSEYNEKIEQFKRHHKDNVSVVAYMTKLETEMKSKMHVDYLEDSEAFEYYFDMIFAQKYAQQNRRIMIKSVLEELDIKYKEENEIETVHNYIDFNDFIIRKGAIAAHNGQKCLISLNMRDGTLLCIGKGNPDWNFSSAHGAGRLLLRDQARNRITMNRFREQMKGIYSTSILPETLDESPDAYKDSNMIISEIEPSVEIIDQFRPIINVKGYD